MHLDQVVVNNYFLNKKKFPKSRKSSTLKYKSGQQDLNLRPRGPQPRALPSYAIPRYLVLYQTVYVFATTFTNFLMPKMQKQLPVLCLDFVFSFLQDRASEQHLSPALLSESKNYFSFVIL